MFKVLKFEKKVHFKTLLNCSKTPDGVCHKKWHLLLILNVFVAKVYKGDSDRTNCWEDCRGIGSPIDNFTLFFT